MSRSILQISKSEPFRDPESSFWPEACGKLGGAPFVTAPGQESLIDACIVEALSGAVGAKLYRLGAADGSSLPDCAPGSHVDVHLGNGMVRPYSLVESGSAPKTYLIAVKLDPKGRGGSVYIHQNFEVGTRLQIGAPRNNFPLVETAAQSVFIAGGIGITPLYCMLRACQEFGRPFRLYYSCRTRSEALFLKELSGIQDVVLHFDDECGGKYFDLSSVIAGLDVDAHVYCCGPSPMLADFAEMAARRLPRSQIHLEYFSAASEAARQGGYTVMLARSGVELSVPADKSILDVLHEHGIDVPYSCGEGVCGACETKVLAGIPDHRDALLTEAERNANKSMMICCSGSKGDRLVLDI